MGDIFGTGKLEMGFTLNITSSVQTIKPTESPLHKAKQRVEVTTRTPVPPSTQQSNHAVHVKPEPFYDQELVDFRGLARCHASLLERACLPHPDLAACPNRSAWWREFAYRPLGEMLFFLTSMRRREMTHKGMENLQILWEEAQGLGFDLSWLAPVMKSVKGISSVLETIS